jgi:hypothetical protein
VPFVVDVEAVVYRMILQVSHVPGDVDDGHNRESLPGEDPGPTRVWGGPVGS